MFVLLAGAIAPGGQGDGAGAASASIPAFRRLRRGAVMVDLMIQMNSWN